MKAMILKKTMPIENEPLQLVNIPAPDPGLGEILVRVRMCGLCHTDLHTVEGDLALPVLPIIPGHQIVGTVAKIGGGSDSARPTGEGAPTNAVSASSSRARAAEPGSLPAGFPRLGDRVGAAWLYSSCGVCAFCRRGLENLCENALFTGFHRHGGYAEYTVMPANFVYPLPDGFSDRDAAPLLCAGIVGYRALKLSGAGRGAVLGLYGFGASAHVAIQVAIHWGCRVLVFTRNEGHRRHAESLGASWVGSSKDRPPEKPTSSIVFAPAGGIVLDALEHLERGGTVAVAGVTMTNIPEMVYENHLYYEKVVRSVTASTREDGREFIELAAAIPIRTDTTLFPLEEANRALRLIKESKISGAGVLDVSSSAERLVPR
jgi:propanol-preferring alcohol dehydrogenase